MLVWGFGLGVMMMMMMMMENGILRTEIGLIVVVVVVWRLG